MDLKLISICTIFVSLASGYSEMRILGGSRGKYCADSGFRAIEAVSALRCARECSSDSQCVSYSMQESSPCLLHANSCSLDNLLTEPKSLYVEVKWECFRSSCYYMRKLLTRRAKADADTECEAMGAHVLAIETAEENDIVTELVFHSSYGPESVTVWIDLVDHITWQHSGQAVTFTNWADGHPDKQAHYKCTALSGDGAWNARRCSTAKSFVCEK